MERFRQYARFLAVLQLLPVVENGEETTLVGGQAVLEGVMMRSPHAWGIAVRRPNGEVTTHSEKLERLSDTHKWMGWPVVRGVMTLAQAMMLGFRALRFSANVALEDIPREEHEKKIELSGGLAVVNVVLSLGFFIVFYKFLPLLAATGLKGMIPALDNRVLFALMEGAIRIGLFLSFIWGISLFPDIRRVYQYHGAEHKTVFAFEDGGELNTRNAQRFVTWHPRCGTSFLMTVMLISIVVYAFFPFTSFWAKMAVRIVMLPVIAGVSYELIRFSARHGKSLFALLTRPGLWLQRITTQPPSDDQVQCAILALEHAMALETAQGGKPLLA